MRRPLPIGICPLCAACLFAPATTFAGMAMPTFTDIARARIEVISFFFVGYLVLAFAYQRIWNSLARDFPKMPRLSYRGALAALIVCGLFLYVVLTMISGARELMTPGAWARSGVLYKIREPEKEPKPWLDSARRASLEKLRAELWRFAEQHGGVFPTPGELPADTFRSIDPNGLLFVYVSGSKPDIGGNVLAYEPGSFGANRMALLSNGEIVEIPLIELKKRVEAQFLTTSDAAAGKAAP